ncbi:hypothetical protein PG996_003279 [Apiospora saccharicola]|uniref:N-acetyltransferase domain-containing protein n=1 Tax=Apiospora saccharicola TaxID=335842 RepID=A0ABR1W0T1_9PEZI
MDDYECEVFDQPGTVFSKEAQAVLHSSLRALGSQCLHPLPDYQVFSADVTAAFANKVLVVARHSGNLVGFVAAVHLLGTPEKLQHPVVHTGLTCVHPHHQRRRGGLKQQMYGHLFLHLLSRPSHRRGFWVTTVTDIVSSLVDMSRVSVHNFPSLPSSSSSTTISGTSEGRPSEEHLLIARDFSARRRLEALVAATAGFDEQVFLFRGSNDHAAAAAFRKDVDDRGRYWHRDRATSEFYRGLIRPGTGDEVLLVGFIDPGHLQAVASGEAYRDRWKGRYAKL